MKIFLDTSSLFKLYHQEDGTQELEQLFSQAKITHIYLSKLLQTLMEREYLATKMPSH